jgi:pimeloyl-ACP methyl ester carboxylesterase
MLIAVTSLGALLAGCAGQPDAASGSAPAASYEPRDTCFTDLPEQVDDDLAFECGYVVVPETRGAGDGRTVELGVMRFDSGQDESRAPLFMLAGGPGQTAIELDSLALMQTRLLGQVLKDRDIVLLEQRGTRNTSVHLDCPEIQASAWVAYERGLDELETETLQVGLLEQCIDEFEAQGVNLDAYNSVENAADVDAAREALGYDRIIYYGASYGSQLGQHVMRDFPDSLQAVILDGANSLSRKSWVEDRALDAEWGIDNLTSLCEADPGCRDNYDIPRLVDAALAQFDDGPLPYRFTDPSDPSLAVEGFVTVDDLAGLIYEMQGSVIGAFALPATLELLGTKGNTDTLVEVLGQRKGGELLAGRQASGPAGMAMLMHFAMVCSDDPVHSTDDVITDGTGAYATRHGIFLAEEYVLACSVLDMEELPDSTDRDVDVDVPVLLLSGGLDVATPSYRSQIVADALPNATHLVFPGRTHVQLSGVNLCAFDIMAQFTRNPNGSLDTSCMKETPVMGFILGDGTISTDQGATSPQD